MPSNAQSDETRRIYTERRVSTRQEIEQRRVADGSTLRDFYERQRRESQ